MQKEISKKVPGGKLLKVRVDLNGDRIVEIKIMGDFFMHPEEALEDLEKALLGVTLVEVESVTDDFLVQNGVTWVGMTAIDLADLLVESL